VSRRRLDALEAEIRETRGRLAALLARADREYGLRAGLSGLSRIAAKPAGKAEDAAGLLQNLAAPAAILAFVAGLVGARRAGRPLRRPALMATRCS
jgi:hypothetical protein